MPRKTLGQKVSRKPERAAQVDAVLAQGPQGHPTCRAVLKLLDEATRLIRERIGGAKPSPEIQAMAIGYCFSTMRDRTGPFSHIDVRTLVQKAFAEGWAKSEEYRRIRGG